LINKDKTIKTVSGHESSLWWSLYRILIPLELWSIIYYRYWKNQNMLG